MKDSGDVLEIEDDRGTIHTEKLVRAIWTRAQSAGLLFERRLETAGQLAISAQI